MEQKIYIIGNGVIGKALALSLKLAGKPVILIRGSVDGLEDHQETVSLETGTQTLETELLVSTIGNQNQLDGLIILSNKSFGNEKLAEKLAAKASDMPIVFLQNGLNVEQAFIEKGFSQLYRCVLMATSQSGAENDQIRFRQIAPSPVGIISGNEDKSKEIVDAIHTELFSFRTETNIQKVIWKKVITNCVFNSICPLLETDNGIFQRNDAAIEIAKQVIGECIAVANAEGIDLTEMEVLDNVLSISHISDGQKISTYQDILNGRDTEIETLNLAVAKTAAAVGVLDVSATSLLGKLTKLKADLFKNPQVDI